MILKFRILYWIGLLLCVVWWGVLYYWRDGILGKIESLYGARSIYSYAWALAWLMPTTPLLLGVLAEGRYVLRKRREVFGKCVKCGYDLRASKDRCPECGTEFEMGKH